MGPLPNATNGHKLPKHPHCPIPKLQHQNLPSCHSLADLMKLQEPTCCSIHCISKQIGSNFRFTNQMIRKKSNTSAICMYIMCNLKTSFMISDLIYDIYFWHSYGNSRIYLLFRSYYIILDLIFMTFILLFKSYYTIWI